MTPDEVVSILEKLRNASCGNNYDGSPCKVRSKEEHEALTSAISLIQDYQKLLKKEGEAQTVLDAWFSIFQTNQLTHAQARLEQAEKEAEKYQKLRERVKEWNCDNPNCGNGAICNFCALRIDIMKLSKQS